MVFSPDSTNSSYPELKDEESPPQLKSADGIPNGGLRAWLQVLGSFMVFLNTWYAFLAHSILSYWIVLTGR